MTSFFPIAACILITSAAGCLATCILITSGAGWGGGVIYYRFCIGKLNIFATNGNDNGEESINSQVFRSKNSQFANKKFLEKSAQSQEKLIQARATERSQCPATTSTVLTRNQEVIQTFLYTSDIILTFVYTLIYTHFELQQSTYNYIFCIYTQINIYHNNCREKNTNPLGQE